jgi:hypothetical protein
MKRVTIAFWRPKPSSLLSHEGEPSAGSARRWTFQRALHPWPGVAGRAHGVSVSTQRRQVALEEGDYEHAFALAIQLAIMRAASMSR